MTRALSEILDGIDKCRPRGMHASQMDIAGPPGVGEVLDALHSFSEIVRYLNTRRSRGAVLELEDEAAVQDALYLMLRPWILDLTPESPTDRVANTFSIKDFVSPGGRFVIEAKYVRDKSHGKSIVKEMNDDIETYRYHANCDDLIFFVYDPNSHIPDSAALERHLVTTRMYGTKALRCHAVIKP